MNGLLTALLGGAAGAGQGMQYQDEKALRLEQQRMAIENQKMSRLGLASDLLSKGITPPSDLLAGWNLGNGTSEPAQAQAVPQVAQQGPTPSMPPAPQGLLSQIMRRGADLPASERPVGPFTPQQPQFNAAPSTPAVPQGSPTQPGGMSGTDVLRSFGGSMNVGGLQYDPMKSLAMRQVLFGAYGKGLEKQQDYQIHMQEIQDKASALVQAGTKMPDGSPMTFQQAMAVAANGDTAFQRAPILGSQAYNQARAGEAAAVAPVDVGKSVAIARATMPLDVSKATQIAQAVAPIEQAKAVGTANALLPTKVAEAKAINATHLADPKYMSEQTNKILDDYRTESQDFKKSLSGYQVLKGAIANPGIATPFAVLDAYARVINPGAVVRQGTMQVLQEMGSYDSKVRRWLSMAENGQWPDDMLQSIKGTIDGIMQEHYNTYVEGAKNRALLRGKAAGVDITPYLDPDPKEFAGGSKQSAVPIATRVQQLKASGMSKEQAKAQLAKEGYPDMQP